MRRRRLVFQRIARPGSSPGTVHSPHGAAETTIRATAYDAEELADEEVEDAAAARRLAPARAGKDARGVLWADVTGLASAARIEGFERAFGIHPLALEDVANVGQRPKSERYDTFLFVVARALRATGSGGPEAGPEIVDEQVALILGDGYVATFRESDGGSFDGVRDRLREGRVRLRGGGAAYLFVALLDALVDGYFPVLEQLSEHLEVLEERATKETSPGLLDDVYRAKREVLGLRRAIHPLRDLTAGLVRSRPPEFDEEAYLNLRDVADHLAQAADVLEAYREIATSLVEVHLSLLGHRSNEVMRVLTVVTALFIPLSFLAAVYGMNFRHMPELDWPNGYFFFWAACGVVATLLLVAFARLGWLRPPSSR